MPKLRTILVAVIIAAGSLNTDANADANVYDVQINQQIQGTLGQDRQYLIKEKEINEIKNIKKSLPSEAPSQKSSSDNQDKWCFNAQTIEIQGNSIFSEAELRNKFLKNPPECFKQSDLENIKTNIENFYIGKGYSNARVYFDEDAAKQQILLIRIYEGTVENITLNNNSKLDEYFPLRKKPQLFTAFPFAKNKVFNLQDFEQGLDQINRLSSSKATINVEPGSEVGTSDIVVNNTITNPTRVSLGYDNFGQERTGKFRKRISLSQDNLLALNDNLYINYTKDNVSKESERYSESMYTNLSVPLGYWTASASYFYSKYLATYDLTQSTLKNRGFFEVQNYKLDRALLRTKSYKIKMGGELEIKNVRSYYNDIKISTQSRVLVPASLYLDSVFYAKNSILYLKPSYTIGTKLLNAGQDSSNLNQTSPHSQYELLKLYGYYNYNFLLPKTELPLNYTLSFDVQHSYDSLYNTEQLNIGGIYSVRGFSYNVLSGDNGYNVRNDLRAKVANLVPQEFRKSSASNKFDLPYVMNRSFITLFYDYGYVRNRFVTDRTKEGHMSGAGTKFSYYGQYLDWNVTYAKAIHSPQFIETVYHQSKDNETIYFNVNVNF